MSVINYKQLLRDRLWAIFEGNPQFVAVVSAGNRLKDEKEAWLQQYMMQSDPGRLPYVRVRLFSSVNSAFTLGENFGMERVDYLNPIADPDELGMGVTPVPGSNNVLWAFRVRVVFVELIDEADEQDSLVDLAQIAIVASGPKLGLSWVRNYSEITCDQEETPDGESKGILRVRTEMTFQINCEFNVQDIVSQA